MPGLKSQIQRDLERRLADKLAQWAKDSVDLYKMGNLSMRDALTDIIYMLVDLTAHMIVSWDLKEETIFRMLKLLIEEKREKESADDEL